MSAWTMLGLGLIGWCVVAFMGGVALWLRSRALATFAELDRHPEEWS